jgi:hypothetical protein
MTFVEDDFVKGKVRWVVELRSGKIIYQDDERPGELEPSAWRRLAAYLKTESEEISVGWLQFRSHRVQVFFPGASAYYMAKLAQKSWEDADTTHGFVTGEIRNGVLRVISWKGPELTILRPEEERSIDPNSEFLIYSGEPRG